MEEEKTILTLPKITELIPCSDFRNGIFNYCFIIVGTGGTGGYLVRDLARIIANFNEKYFQTNSMLLIDGDEVRQI